MSEEDIELRDLVAQTLENNGVLSKIRAELRASVFLALEEQEAVMDSAQFTNKPLKAFLSTTEGSLVASLVREFLEYFKLDFTLSVYDPETSQGKYYNYGGRNKLMKDLQLENMNGKKGPLLTQILQLALGSTNVKKDGSKLNNDKNASTLTSTPVRSSVQNTLLLDSTPPSSAKVDKVLTPQTLNFTKNDVPVTKASSSIETKPPSTTVDTAPKQTEINVIPKLKDLQLTLPAEKDESPRSFSISEQEQTSNKSKEDSVSKKESLETSPSHSLPKSTSLNKSDKQEASNSESSQKSISRPDSKKKEQVQQNNKKPNTEPVTKGAISGLSSLSNLPPLSGVGYPSKQPASVLPAISQQKDMHQIKAMINLGLDSRDNYEEDFHSTASASAKDDHTNQGTDSEIEEDLGSGVDDLLSSASAVDDLTADATLSNLTGVADYMEDVK